MAYVTTTAWRMKERRKMLGFTLAQVAERAGCTTGLISHIENERVETPRPLTQQVIAKALNCSVTWLFDGNIYDAPQGFYAAMHKLPGKH